MSQSPDEVSGKPKSNRTGGWIALGLGLGIVCGILFGEYCRFLQIVGRAYVGFLQMTVLPYLAVSLVAKLGRLNAARAKQMGVKSLIALLGFWGIGILIVTLASAILPPIEGASFFHSAEIQSETATPDFFSTFIPTNIFRSLSQELVPAVVVFCLFCGVALISVPQKEPLLDFLDLCSQVISQINLFLVRLAPIGLFALTASAAGTLRLEEVARLQAYLLLYGFVCLLSVFGVLPLLVCSLTRIRYWDLLRAAQEPLYTAIATGKLFVTLPQIVEKCEGLIRQENPENSSNEEATANVLVPLAYPFPHLGKVLSFVFISFSAWYVGQDLTPTQTLVMASTGTVSSFASPLVTIPYLLDQYRLPQDLIGLFITPGFVTMRLGDIVGVMHLMAFTLIIQQAMLGQLRIRWRFLAGSLLGLFFCSLLGGLAARWYLASTVLKYDLDQKFLSLEVPNPRDDVQVFQTRKPREVPVETMESTLDRIQKTKVLRVGYHPQHLPYSYLNQQGHLVGMDVELIHRLAHRLDLRVEFIPFENDTILDQLESREIDLAIGGLIVKPERLLQANFTKSYETATLALVVKDYRRNEAKQWTDFERLPDFQLAVVSEDLAIAAKREYPDAKITVIDSIERFFQDDSRTFDGLVIAAEAGAAWTILHPDYSTIVPTPILRRPVGMATRRNDLAWVEFLNGWLEFERVDGSLPRLRQYWLEGGGTQVQKPRWCVLRDVLHWLPD